MTGVEVALIAGAAMSAYGSIRQGWANKANAQAMAQQAEIQSRSMALNERAKAQGYQQQAIAVLEKANENLATISAAAAAGGLDPFRPGSSLANLQDDVLYNAVWDRNIHASNEAMAMDNAAIVAASGAFQSAIYSAAGDAAMDNAFLTAGATLASAGYQSQQAGMFSSTQSGFVYDPYYKPTGYASS